MLSVLKAVEAHVHIPAKHDVGYGPYGRKAEKQKTSPLRTEPADSYRCRLRDRKRCGVECVIRPNVRRLGDPHRPQSHRICSSGDELASHCSDRGKLDMPDRILLLISNHHGSRRRKAHPNVRSWSNAGQGNRLIDRAGRMQVQQQQDGGMGGDVAFTYLSHPEGEGEIVVRRVDRFLNCLSNGVRCSAIASLPPWRALSVSPSESSPFWFW